MVSLVTVLIEHVDPAQGGRAGERVCRMRNVSVRVRYSQHTPTVGCQYVGIPSVWSFTELVPPPPLAPRLVAHGRESKP